MPPGSGQGEMSSQPQNSALSHNKKPSRSHSLLNNETNQNLSNVGHHDESFFQSTMKSNTDGGNKINVTNSGEMLPGDLIHSTYGGSNDQQYQ